MVKRAQKKRQQTISTPARTSPGAPLDATRPFNWRNREDLIPLAIVLGVALVLRIVFFYLNQRNNPVFFYPIMDAVYHDDWAKDILAGGTRGEDVFFRGPLYPYLLAALYKISGSSIAFAVFAQHLMGTITAGLIYLLAREHFSSRVALLAGLGGALYWPFVYFEGDLLIVTTILLLNTLSLLFLSMATRKNSLWLFAAAGLSLGLSAIARPSVLIFFPVVPAYLYWLRGKIPSGSTGWLGRFAVVAAAAALMILPVMIRNFAVAGAVVPVAASGGVNFYIGNNPASDGSTAIVPGTRADWWGGYEDAIAIAERERGRKLSLSEVSNYYFERGFRFITSRPDEAWSLMFKKARMFWAGPERANNKFIYFFWNLAGMRYVPLPGFWLVAPLGLLGMFVLWRRRQELSHLYLFVLLYSIGVIAFFVNARFRLPIMPIIILFAAYAVHYLVVTFREKSFYLIQAIVVLALATILVNSDYIWFNKIRAYSNAFSHNTLGNAYLKMGLSDTALRHFQRSIEIDRENPTDAFKLIERDVNYNMGLLLADQGMCTRAIEALEKVGGDDIFAITALDRLGDCYLKRNQLTQAQLAYQRLIAIDKDDERGVVGMARCAAAAGSVLEAERMLESIVDPSGAVYPPAYIALAEVQVRLGKIDKAIESYTNISNFLGYERDALIQLAVLYKDTGQRDQALDAVEKLQRYTGPNDPVIRGLLQDIRGR